MREENAMAEEDHRLFALFEEIIAGERQAQERYKRAMELCRDPMLKAVLKGFYEDEIRHEKAVIGRYHQFKGE